jgi:hypothetical protein
MASILWKFTSMAVSYCPRNSPSSLQTVNLKTAVQPYGGFLFYKKSRRNCFPRDSFLFPVNHFSVHDGGIAFSTNGSQRIGIPDNHIAILACFPVAPALGNLLTRAGRSSRAVAKLNALLSIAIPPILIIISLLALVGNSYNPFLYFQF